MAAEETKEERVARLNAEAAQRAADLNAASKQKVIDKEDEMVLFYSTLPKFYLGIQSQTKQLVPLAGTGAFTYATTQKNRRVQFHEHRGLVRRGDIPTVRKMNGYGDRFVECRDLKDGDNLAGSLEKWEDAVDPRFDQFCAMIETKQGMISPRQMDARREIKLAINALKKKGAFA